METLMQFSSRATRTEGLEVSIDNGQMLEASKIILMQLAAMPMGEACAFIAKHGTKPPKRKKGR